MKKLENKGGGDKLKFQSAGHGPPKNSAYTNGQLQFLSLERHTWFGLKKMDTVAGIVSHYSLHRGSIKISVMTNTP